MLDQDETWILEYIEKRLTLPSGWKHHDEYDDTEMKDLYPTVINATGEVVLNEWMHKERDEKVRLHFYGDLKQPFFVKIETETGIKHSHKAGTVNEAISGCSMAMCMMNRNSEQSDNDDDVEKLKERIEELENMLEDERSRASELKSKNETLRSQASTLIDTQTSGYTDGEWLNYDLPQQSWRPPFRNEVIRFVEHIDRNWYGNQDVIEVGVSDIALEVLEEMNMIVLDDYEPTVDRVEDKMLFVMYRADDLYNVYLFSDEDQSLKEVKQHGSMLSSMGKGGIVLSPSGDTYDTNPPES